MSTPPPIPPPAPAQGNFGMQAAKASWIAPIVGVALNVLTNSQTHTRAERGVIGFASFAIYILGLVFGIVALATIRKYGRKSILVPALVGVAINGFLVLIFTLVLILASRDAH